MVYNSLAGGKAKMEARCGRGECVEHSLIAKHCFSLVFLSTLNIWSKQQIVNCSIINISAPLPYKEAASD